MNIRLYRGHADNVSRDGFRTPLLDWYYKDVAFSIQRHGVMSAVCLSMSGNVFLSIL